MISALHLEMPSLDILFGTAAEQESSSKIIKISTGFAFRHTWYDSQYLHSNTPSQAVKTWNTFDINDNHR